MTQELGKFLKGREQSHFERFKESFIGNDKSYFKKKNKPYFFNNIGLHNGFNDAALTLFLFNAILKRNNQTITQDITDKTLRVIEQQVKKRHIVKTPSIKL